MIPYNYDMEIGNLEQKITITDTPNELKHSDIIIVCAGNAVPTNITDVKESNKSNTNNRNLLYSINKDIVLHGYHMFQHLLLKHW